MKLILLYGPPAVGKVTIAKTLVEKTGFILFHNHLLQNPIAEVFPFDNPVNWQLVREFRLRILEEAVKSNIDLIVTFGIAGSSPFTHLSQMIKKVESLHGTVCLVHLTANRKTILDRVENTSRKQQGKNLSKQTLIDLLDNNPDMFDTYPGKSHLVIDTTETSPRVAAEKITIFYHLQ